MDPLQRVADFLINARPSPTGGESGPAALVIEGEAGIGKSTLWRAGINLAAEHGYQVLAASPTRSEAALSYTVLADLLDPVFDELPARLDPRARTALEIALLRRSATPDRSSDLTGPRPRELGVAVLAAVRHLADTGPTLIAIDDEQWIDRGSAEVLAFALRRSGGRSPVKVLLCRRTGVSPDEPDEAGRPLPESLAAALSAEAVTLLPLTDPAMLELVSTRLGATASLRLRQRVVLAAEGNPYRAGELVRALADVLRAEPDREPTELPLPDSLAQTLADRLAALSAPALAALVVVAALGRPSWETASQALDGRVPDPAAALDAAVASAAIVVSVGRSGTAARLQPSHPLLGAAAVHALLPGERRVLHRQLAAVVQGAEERARHLALGSAAPDPGVAAALDAGAAAARARGATYAAAELSELAMTFTPPQLNGDRVRRMLEATELSFAVGDLDRAAELGTHLAAGELSVTEWERLLPVLVEAVYWTHGQPAAQRLLGDLLRRPHQPTRVRAVALACAADVGDGAGTPRAALVSEATALYAALGERDPAVLSTALVCLSDDQLDSGDGMALDLLARAVIAERQGSRWIPVCNRATSCRSYQRKIVDDLDGARAELTAAIQRAHAEGDETSLPALLGHLALTEYWAGRYPAGLDAAREGLAHASADRGVAPTVLYASRALLAVVTGDLATAREIVAGQLRADAATPPNKKTLVYAHVLGLAALLDGEYRTALHHLDAARRLAETLGVREPGRRQRLEGDLGEALLANHRIDQALELGREHRTFGERHDRPTIVGVGYRIEGLALAAAGDFGAALAALEQAVAAHQISPLRLELPRSQLALGQTQRRSRARRPARATIEAAAAGFAALGATPYTALARAELHRLGGPRSATRLTSTEERVALLAGKGLSNQAIADELYISVRTVEGHLANVYRKLEITGRRDLIGYQHPGTA